MMTRKPMACAVVTVVLVALSACALARDVEGDAEDGGISERLSDARRALIMGDTEGAVRAYREILDAHPEDIRAFWGLVGAYSAAAMDRDHLVPLLVSWLGSHPQDRRAHTELGKAYARLGERDLAHETWSGILHQGRPDGALYAEVGSLEMAHNMVEEAIETYSDARLAFRTPSLFARELVRAYTLLRRYERAIDECVVAVEEREALIQWAVNRVEVMLEQGADQREVEDRMKSIVAGAESGRASLGFAGSVLLAVGMHEAARDAFLTADETATDEGRALLEYGRVMAEAGRSAEARELYAAIAERHPDSVNAAMAGVDAGLILAREGDLDEALAELKAVGVRYAEHASGAQALLAAARIELNDKRDPSAAMETIDTLIATRRQGDAALMREGRLLRSDAYLALGRFDEAHTEARSVLEGRSRAPARERAMFNAAFASFLMGESRPALDEFRAMVSENMSGALANDALRIMLIIAEGEEELGPEPISLLTSAHAARLRGDASQAAAHLETIASGYEGSAVATEALLLRGALAEDGGDEAAALEAYRRVWDGSGMITARAEAMMRSGDILSETANRTRESMSAYAAILEELPENALSGEARRKIERIRRAGGRNG